MAKKLPSDIADMTIEQVESALNELASPEARKERERWVTTRDYYQELIEERAGRRVNLQQRQVELLKAKIGK